MGKNIDSPHAERVPPAWCDPGVVIDPHRVYDTVARRVDVPHDQAPWCLSLCARSPACTAPLPHSTAALVGRFSLNGLELKGALCLQLQARRAVARGSYVYICSQFSNWVCRDRGKLGRLLL